MRRFLNTLGQQFTIARRTSALAAFASLLPIAAWAQFAVSQTGQPTYRYQIEVPPGIAGMLPSTSLQHDGSQHGIAGEGWRLTVGSTIGRCAATVATDGARAPVRNGTADKLCLDGKRLIQTDASGAPLPFPQANDSLGLLSGYREYRSEQDSYARIRAYGAANGNVSNGPAYFKVWTKAGQVYEYGTGPASDSLTSATLSATAGGVAISWGVARISDLASNYIDFKYQLSSNAWGTGSTAGTSQAGSEWNLAEIDYTGNINAAQAPSNRVVFEYETRPSTSALPQDSSESFNLGTKSLRTLRLKAVATYVNASYQGSLYAGGGNAAKRFLLAYETGGQSGRSRLKTITECSGSGSRCFKPTTFDYKDGSGEAFATNAAFNLQTEDLRSTSGTTGILVADFNGDGKTDLLRWSDTPSLNGLYMSNGDGTFRQVTAGPSAGQFNVTDQNLGKSDGCYYTVVADFNGDGLPDLLRLAGTTTTSGTSCGTTGSNYLYLNQGDGSFSAPKTLTGLQQLMRVVSKATTDCIYPSQSEANSQCTEPGDKRGWTSGYTFYLLDVDGDGKMDVVFAFYPGVRPTTNPIDTCPQTQCTWVYKGDGQGGFTDITPASAVHLSMYSAPDGLNAVGQPSHIVDIDGDGLSDIVQTVGGAFRSQGNGSFDATASQYCGYSIDFNGDGMNDCLRLSGSAASLVALYWGDGNGPIYSTENFNLKSVAADLYGSGIGIIIADVNGDGRDDILRWKDGGAGNKVYLSNGDGTFTESIAFNLNTTDTELRNAAGTTVFVTGNFTGQGQLEILRLKAASNQLYTKSDPTPLDHLWRVTSPSGRETSWATQPLSNTDSSVVGPRYISDRGTLNAATYPSMDLTPSMQVVTTVTEDMGVGSGTSKTTSRTEYAYRGFKTSVAGRGALGFRQRLRQGIGGNGSPISTNEEYAQTYPYTGMLRKVEVFSSTIDSQSTATRLRSVVTSYCDQTGDASSLDLCPSTAVIKRPYVRQTVESGWELNGEALPVTTMLNSPNEFGDTTSASKSTTGNTAGITQTYSQTTISQYDAARTDGDNWIIGRLNRRTVSNTVPNNINDVATSAGTGPNALANSLHSVATLSNISFGNVTIGATKTGQATLTNTGRGSFVVPQAGLTVSGSNLSLAGTTCPASLGEGQSCTISVNLSATAITSYSGTLTVASGAGTKTANIAGAGVSPTVTITPQSANWGVVGTASDSGDWLTVTNNSDVSVRITGHGVVSGPSGMWAWQGISDAGYCLVGTTVLGPGASCKTFFGMGVATTGSYSATNQISYVSVNASGTTFTVQQSYTFTVATSTVNVSSLAFGNVAVNATSAAQSFTLTNNAVNGGSLLNLSITLGGTSPSLYSLSHNCGTALGAGSSCTITVTFSPKAIASNVTAAVSITGGYARIAGGSVDTSKAVGTGVNLSIPLSGNGLGSAVTVASNTASGLSTSFKGSSATGVVTFVNNGNAAATLTMSGLSGAFSLSPSSCSIAASGGTCAVTVTMSSATAGSQGTQTLVATGGSLGTAAASISGTVNSPALSLSASSLAFGTVLRGNVKSLSVTVTNSGAGTASGISSSISPASGTSGTYSTSVCSSLAPGASCSLTVTYDASCSAGSLSGTVTLSGSNFNSLSLTTSATNASGKCV